ncbi:MAG TPA: hypothetical protein VKT33_06850 [Candidatus Angelobacter sp.]|nr:hypothetical protein [Candidatus Angelobacter sp.]
MKVQKVRLLLPTINLIVCVVLLAPLSVWAASPITMSSLKNDVSPPLRNLAASSTVNGSQQQQQPVAQPTGPALSNPNPDPVAQQLTTPLSGVSTGLNFEGQSASDTLNLLGVAFVPPDTNGAAGATQFVQIVNVTFAVYDKRTGELLLGPALISDIWKGFGGPCESGNGGDPVVLYDQIAGRWMISQLQFNNNFTSNQECVAVSTSSDATGSFNRYVFDFGANFPDFPKFGIWPDAYYFSANIFTTFNGSSSFAGAEACAFNRAAMLAGSPATAICFPNPASVASLLPSDLDGRALPPAGEPNFFVEIADSSDLALFRFHVDFASPSSSSFSGPVLIPVAPFNEICARAINLSCITQPAPGEKVDALSDRLSFRLAYRNFGDHESLVVNHTIEGGALGAVRWYEIRNPQSTPAVFQQGTIVDPNISFWLGSTAMDSAGNMAIGFSASGKALNPSVFAAGRATTDPLGTMSGPLILVTGTGVQETSFHRWGDYSSMAVDPGDDCTFWYTQEYYKTTGSFNWTTRIASFKFNSCKP